MGVQKITEEQEPTFSESLKQGYKWLNKSAEVRLICWVITILFLLFASATLLKADSVYAYASLSVCEAENGPHKAISGT